MPQKTMNIDKHMVQAERRWAVMDANGTVLGRVASKAAQLLRGKHKALFTPSVDCGDFVVVTNVDKIRLTGEKADVKTYFRHSGYAGGAKVIPYKTQMERDARKVLYEAVKGMLPATRLRQHQLRRLKLYIGDAHPHAAQKVEAVSV
jgi:large subunit ribosomal protein L13